MIISDYDIKLRRGDWATIVFLGDLHLGSKNCDLNNLMRAISFIAKTDNCYWFAMGDMAEFIPKTDGRFDPENVHPDFLESIATLPQAQARDIMKRCQPIAHKLIGYHYGNHEARMIREHSYDPLENWEDWGINLGTGDAITRLYFKDGKHTDLIKVMTAHGASSAITDAAKMAAVVKVSADMEGIDITASGHTHALGVQIKSAVGAQDKRGAGLWERNKAFISTGSYLKKWMLGTTGYAEARKYPSVKLGSPYVTLCFRESKQGDVTKPFKMGWGYLP